MDRAGGRYRFGPRERRGLIAGWRGGQITAVAAGLVLAVLALRSRPTVPSVVAAVVAAGGGVAVAWWPVAGRTAEEWLPTVVRWTLGGGGRRRLHPSRQAARGHCLGPDGQPCLPSPGAGRRAARGTRARPPAGPFGRLAMLSADGEDGRPVAVVLDRRTRTFTAVLEVRGHTFALLGPREKDGRVAGWASVLASLARERSAVHRLQWLATTVPDDGDALRRHLDERGVLTRGSAAQHSYRELLASSGATTCRHDVLLAVQVRAAGLSGRATRAAAGGGDAGATAVLLREVTGLRRQLEGADVVVERALDPRALAIAIRRTTGAAPVGTSPGCPPCPVGWPWPAATEEEWACVHTDATWHATYWIAEWPRVDVGPEFLGPLLLGSVRRSVSVVMEPVSPTRAVRQVEQARTADLADAELRRRGGFLSTARREREAEGAGRREAELADGHASFRFAGYVTVTAPSKDQLVEACEATEQAAGQCRLDLRRLFGEQEAAYATALPLAVGLA